MSFSRYHLYGLDAMTLTKNGSSNSFATIGEPLTPVGCFHTALAFIGWAAAITPTSRSRSGSSAATLAVIGSTTTEAGILNTPSLISACACIGSANQVPLAMICTTASVMTTAAVIGTAALVTDTPAETVALVKVALPVIGSAVTAKSACAPIP